MTLQKVEGNWGWCCYRVVREEFRIPEFEQILITPVGVIAANIGKFGRGVDKFVFLLICSFRL